MPPVFSLYRSIRRDVEACFARDPACVSLVEVLFANPGFHARQLHRVAHRLHRWRVPWLPRLISHASRVLTGIEIHPGAQIGEGLLIDHGMGVVIGETAVIGDDCTLYQGVTLGGTRTQRVKRHPTLHNRVTVGSGAALIGAVTIGDDVRVGAGSVVVNDVPSGATVVGVPGRVVVRRRVTEQALDELPDPWWDTFEVLADRVRELEGRVRMLEARDGALYSLPEPTVEARVDPPGPSEET